WLDATDPMGGNEHVEFRHGAPGIPVPGEQVPTGLQATSSYLQFRNSFYWDKRAWSLYPGDYTKATLYHWLHTTDINVTSGTMESMKRPLESRIWYDYPGQNMPWALGLTAQPIAAAR